MILLAERILKNETIKLCEKITISTVRSNCNEIMKFLPPKELLKASLVLDGYHQIKVLEILSDMVRKKNE